jgi:uncharacterized protein YbcC (UPF0753/DUF2309 family)
MSEHGPSFHEHAVLHELKHYLPAQASLKDFVHHNTLHAFQGEKFHRAIRQASEIFGYKVSLKLAEYRELYHSGSIQEKVLEKIITQRKGAAAVPEWKDKALHHSYHTDAPPRIGSLRAGWKRDYHIDLDSLVHPLLFRILCSYLDQGIAIWSFPVKELSFLEAIRKMEATSFTSFFRTTRVRKLLLETSCKIEDLLKIIVGPDAQLYKHYLFDQQFSHPGWSGMVSVVEDTPATLLDTRHISLHDLIVFETLLEIDALDFHFGEKWKPLQQGMSEVPADLFAEVTITELHEVLSIWQEAFEWSYYDQVLKGIQLQTGKSRKKENKTFQAFFCIDDREYSLRKYVEKLDPHCETLGTPGFFAMEFFFQPQGGKFYSKLCPAPVTPTHLIKEYDSQEKQEKEAYFTKHSHNFYTGWIISQTLGFWSALKLFLNIFKPSMSPATATSFRHMDRSASLTIENKNRHDRENCLQIGFTVEEMASRTEILLKSTGLVKDFAPLVYIIGHGSTSVNNPHYAAYDCGACAGRAGSVNARVAAYAANHPRVRELLAEKGLVIPEETQFLGGLHDTTRDEMVFFDENTLSLKHVPLHQANLEIFNKALDKNAKERSRRFVSVNTHRPASKVHEEVLRRSVSLFEPRPELNHATNALCVVGRRNMTDRLFLDRRSFLNSFDYRVDPDGKYLASILNAVAPVCGGINLEYLFARVDNQKLGAGTKLPHNVMGLFGVANGIDGDLRPGLPSQMIEVHDPLRLLVIVEHFPEVVLDTIQKNPATYEWFINEWVNLVAKDPETDRFYKFIDGRFEEYYPSVEKLETVSDLEKLVESSADNLPVYLIQPRSVS